MFRRGFRTKGDAETALDDLRAQLAAGTVPVPSDDTVTAFAMSWIAALPAEGVEPATTKHYAECVNRILPTIGAIPIQHLAALDRSHKPESPSVRQRRHHL
jgi:hypothetical protein